MAMSPKIADLIQRVAQEHGMSPAVLKRYVMIESGGDPRNVTGSYKGLGQLSHGEFNRYQPGGDIFDPRQNLTALALKVKAHSADFERKHGRPADPADIYLVHQQGQGGYDAHMKNPDAPAWQNMASTAEGRQRGEKWSKLAIWGNVPDQLKAQYGSVDNMTSQQFMDMWRNKVNGGGVESPHQNHAPEHMPPLAPILKAVEEVPGEVSYVPDMAAILRSGAAGPETSKDAPPVSPSTPPTTPFSEMDAENIGKALGSLRSTPHKMQPFKFSIRAPQNQVSGGSWVNVGSTPKKA